MGPPSGGSSSSWSTTALAVLLSYEWFATDPRRGELYSLLLLSALGAVLLAGATDLMEMVLGVLLSSATGYVLAGYHRRSVRAQEAAIKYYLLGALATGFMLFGVVLLFGLGGSTLFGALRASLVQRRRAGRSRSPSASSPSASPSRSAPFPPTPGCRTSPMGRRPRWPPS